MLVLLALHIIISFFCLWAGYLFYRLFSRSLIERSLVLYLVSGLILLTMIAQVLVLIIPLNGLVTAVLFVLLVLSMFLLRKQAASFYRSIFGQFAALPIMARLAALASWLMIIVINAGPVIMDDTESYHIQMVKWIQEYGTVPGIANLHERYGFNSSWFSSIALFNPFVPQLKFYTVLNGVVSAWFSFYLVQQISTRENPGSRLALFFVLILSFFAWPLLRGNAATANYDFITTLIVFVLFVETFHNNLSFSSSEWLIWPVYLVTVRLTNYPFLILSLFALFHVLKNYDRRSLGIFIIGTVLLIAPFLMRNLVLSGYMFYPSPFLGVLEPDWKVDPVVTEKLLEYIKYYNRINTKYSDIEQTRNLGEFGWILAWFKNLFLFDKVLLIPGVMGILTGIAFVKKPKNKIDLKYLIVLLTFLIALVSWFIIAPDPRFIYGILLAGNFMLFHHLQSYFKVVVEEKYSRIPFATIALLVVLYTVRKAREQNFNNVVFVTPLPEPGFDVISSNNGNYNLPKFYKDNWNRRCYDIELPCLYEIDPRLEMRGNSIRDGYRLKK